MKKKIFAGILTTVMALTVVFAGCADDNAGGGEKYTVTFNAGAGTVTPESTKVNKGGKVSEPTATYTGHHVEGWYEESTFDNLWVFSENTVQSDITLHANWEANTYQVTLDVNGGDKLENSTQSVTYNQSYNLGSPTRRGYNFDGWTYNDSLITDRNGKGKANYTYTEDITVKAKWTADTVEGSDDVSGLETAIENMGYNYTAVIWDNDNTTDSLYKIGTEKGIYNKAESDYASSGYLFDGNLVFKFKNRVGYAQIEDEPYKKEDGTNYTKTDIYATEYLATVLTPEAYVYQENGIYACRSEYRDQQASALLGADGSPLSLIVRVKGDYIDSISIIDFLYSGSSKEDTIEIEFSNIGTSSIDEFLKENSAKGDYQLPGPTDPNKPVAPTSIPGSDGVKPVDSVPSSAYTNGSNDNALPALKAAIDSARQEIRYNFEEYFDDTANKGGSKWYPSSQYYIAQFEGYKAYVARSYDDSYQPTNENYIVLSGGVVYRIDETNGVIQYVERPGNTFEDRTLGGNIFFSLNASMFEQSAVNPNAFLVKSQYLDAVCEILFYCAREPNYYNFEYTKTPAIKNKSVTIVLTNDGKFQSIEAERVFDFNDGFPADIQQMKFSFDYNTKLVMPYEQFYSSDELVLKNAIVKTGNNYTLDYIYYDGWQVTEYYADNGIWKWIRESLFGSSGFVYINDYAYFFDFDTQHNNALVVDDEPWWGGTYPKETDGLYYRAWMNVYYLPLAQIDARDFNRTGDNEFTCKSSVLLKYENMFFDFNDEGGIDSLKVFLTADGYIEKIEAYNWYMGNDAAYASTVYVADIGTTELQFLF